MITCHQCNKVVTNEQIQKCDKCKPIAKVYSQLSTDLDKAIQDELNNPPKSIMKDG